MTATTPARPTASRTATPRRRAAKQVPHLSVADRRAKGADARTAVPPSVHGKWSPAADRFDPVELLCDQDARREPDLVPVRHGRMMVSPFTFYRGAARVMASDLADTPNAGLIVQLCGDAHLSNFGGYASPERKLVFDANDFDETLPGPFEWDVKRMVASFTIAAQHNGFAAQDVRAVTLTAVRSYREAMARFATMGQMELWYAHISEDDLTEALDKVAAEVSAAQQKKKGKTAPGKHGKELAKATSAGKHKGKAAPDKAGGKAADKANKKDATKGKSAAKAKDTKSSRNGGAESQARGKSGDDLLRDGGAAQLDAPRNGAGELRALEFTQKALRKAHSRDSLQALSKLGELVDGRYRIISQPPVVVPVREWSSFYGVPEGEIETRIRQLFREYRATLPDDRRQLLERFEVVDVARKVVGVGSVGTRCFIILLQGRDENDPLFLQVKEATASVLEDHLPKSRFANPGERVVQGQRMMQATSDIFLGWSKGVETNRFFYWRQLRDMKASADIDHMQVFGMTFYARLCGWTLARGHARSGDPIALAEYLGTDDAFDRAIADFSEAYAEQNLKDHEAFVTAVKSGVIQAIEGV